MYQHWLHHGEEKHSVRFLSRGVFRLPFYVAFIYRRIDRQMQENAQIVNIRSSPVEISVLIHHI